MPSHNIFPDLSLEEAATGIVAGVDEVGRGPFAGPVVASAVILDRDRLPPGIQDSKNLSRAKREELFELIMATATVGIGEASVEEIDTLNILQATLLAMRRAVEALSHTPNWALVDGNKDPGLGINTRTVIKGDAKSLSIAAASIVAKVTRDRKMCRFAEDYPHYGWERNSGYGTAEHRKGLRDFGVTPLHRRSFAPIRELLKSC
ncbi:MAG: ribonuclease HII [Proteobacteria bacterium]|nr:ribonuclease HII [Pseudomonadota bacterium]